MKANGGPKADVNEDVAIAVLVQCQIRGGCTPVVVILGWTLQHCALPLVSDLKYLAFRFVAFLPGVTLLTLIYMRIRRLPPMIVAHWPMDLGAVIMTLTLR